MRTHQGFTLLELLTAVTIFGILLGIAVPSFTTMMNANRLAAESNDLITSLTLARAEASRRGINVSVCPRSGNACVADATDWSDGWMVFTDDVGTVGVFDDPGDVVLQVSTPRQSDLVVTSDVAAVTYMTTGARTRAALNIAKPGCTGQNKRNINVELTGRISLTRVNC